MLNLGLICAGLCQVAMAHAVTEVNRESNDGPDRELEKNGGKRR